MASRRICRLRAGYEFDATAVYPAQNEVTVQNRVTANQIAERPLVSQIKKEQRTHSREDIGYQSKKAYILKIT